MKKYLFTTVRIMTAVVLFAAAIITMPKATEAAAYTYTNDTYGFSIQCPTEPIGVLDLARQPGGNKGVMLVFENQGMDVTCGWIIMTDAFKDENIPDLSKLTKEQADEVLKAVVAENGIAAIVAVEENPAIYTIAKTEDMAKTYIRGKNGQHYVVALTADKNIFKERLHAYQEGLLTFKTK